MVDIDGAVGFIVARGDAVDRARLSFLRTGTQPAEEILSHAEQGQAASGGWSAQWGGDVASVDATCFRLAELDDLNGLARPSAGQALRWLIARQRPDGFWEEDAVLADLAPPWAKPHDPEARFYLTVNAAFWLTVAATDESNAADGAHPVDKPVDTPAGESLLRAGQAILSALDESGVWPGFLVSGWLAGAVLHRGGWFYEAAQIFVVLRDRVRTMSAADAAWMASALRRVGVAPDDPLLVAARRRLTQTQRPDGAWPSDDAPAFDVHTTLIALRALR